MTPVRRTLPTLLAGVTMLALGGLSIASGHDAPRTAAAALNVPAQQPATTAPGAPMDAAPAPTAAQLAEMTRRLGTPRRVAREGRRHQRALRRALARLHALQRARAAEAAQQAAALRRAAAARRAASSPGYWVDPQANSMSSASPAETAWLQGGRGGWVEASGYARAPANAPDAIKRVIAAGNQIARSPYIWGGGHGAWRDSGYDCSGSVSFALAFGGMLGYTLTSGQLMNWGAPGAGKWLTIYANEGHVFLYVAGLRFDTSGRAGDHASRWQLASRSADGFMARHYPGL